MSSTANEISAQIVGDKTVKELSSPVGIDLGHLGIFIFHLEAQVDSFRDCFSALNLLFVKQDLCTALEETCYLYANQ